MRQFRTARVFAAIAAAVAIVATACAPSGPTSGAPGPGETPVAGGRFVEGSFADIKTMQPILSSDVPSSTVIARLYEGLIQADPKTGELKPNLGKWTVSADGLTYNWEIDAGANWTDGKPIIAQDVATAIKAAGKSKKTVRKTNFQDIVGWKEFAVDGTGDEISGFKVDGANPKKFAVTFSKVFCPALVNVFGSSYVLPTQVFGKYVTKASKDEIDTAPENENPSVTSGPFKFKEWRKGDQVVLDKNSTYWKGAPLLDQYIFKVVADSTVLANQLKTGELTYGTIEAKDYDDIAKQENLAIAEFQQLGYTYIGWNVSSKDAPALGDLKIRQALAYGLDMDAVVKNILFGHGTKMVSHHPAVSWAAPSGALNQYPFDKNKAEQLIKDAGYAKGSDGVYAKGGQPLAFSIVTNSGNKTRETLLQVAGDQYKQIGVKVNQKTEAFETMVDELTTGNQVIQGWIIGWSLGLEPDPYSIWSETQIPDPANKKTGFNFGGFKAPGLEDVMVQGRAPSNGDCSQAARKKQYEKFNQIVNEQQPYNFGFAANVLAVTPKNLREFAPGPFSTYWNIEKWWYKQ